MQFLVGLPSIAHSRFAAQEKPIAVLLQPRAQPQFGVVVGRCDVNVVDAVLQKLFHDGVSFFLGHFAYGERAKDDQGAPVSSASESSLLHVFLPFIHLGAHTCAIGDGMICLPAIHRWSLGTILECAENSEFFHAPCALQDEGLGFGVVMPGEQLVKCLPNESARDDWLCMSSA